MDTTTRQQLAADWGTWASACESRSTTPAPVDPEPTFTITAAVCGRTVWAQRVNVATGQALSADIIPFRKG